MKKKKLKTKVEIRALPRIPRVNRNAYDMRLFHRLTDWSELWEDFNTSIERDGTYKYRSISQFAKAKGTAGVQSDFIKWYLGPVPTHSGYESPYSWLKEGPQDWMHRRKTGGWFSEQNLRKFGMEIRRRMSALEALREAGNGITLHSMIRAEELAQELDRSFKGRMFLDSLTFEQNMARAEAYVALHQKILSMKGNAQDLYAKSHGVNFEDMNGLTVLMQAAAMSGGGVDTGNDRRKAALNAVVEMALMKSQRYQMELPAEAVEVIADTEIATGKKRGVQ